jgi:hypothetical protein
MQVLRSEATAFLLITGTKPAALEEASYFFSRLRQADLPLGACIVNRVNRMPDSKGGAHDSRPTPVASPEDLSGALLLSHLQEYRKLPLRLARALLENFEQCLHLIESDEQVLRDFSRRLSRTTPVRIVRALEEDISDVAGLLKVNSYLFSDRETDCRVPES